MGGAGMTFYASPGLDFFLRCMWEEDLRSMLRQGLGTTCQRHMATAAIYASKLARRRDIEKIEEEATRTKNAQVEGSA